MAVKLQNKTKQTKNKTKQAKQNKTDKNIAIFVSSLFIVAMATKSKQNKKLNHSLICHFTNIVHSDHNCQTPKQNNKSKPNQTKTNKNTAIFASSPFKVTMAVKTKQNSNISLFVFIREKRKKKITAWNNMRASK